MIPVNEPKISKNARKYILDCLNSGWVSSGKYIEKFEKEFAKFIGTKYAVSCSSGTSALHLSIAALDIGRGDEVIMPALTIISSALACIYQGAKPVLVDVDLLTGNIDPKKIEEKITEKTKAIMVVHLYGHPADMDPILKIARKNKLAIIEDAAQAHGAEYAGKRVGGIGDIGCFSFYGNKIITTGEGGMVVTNNKKIWERIKLLRNLAHDPEKRFLHKEIGFSYRMTNLQAALGLSELEEVDELIKKKIWIANEYNKRLHNITNLQLPYTSKNVKNVYWMYGIKLKTPPAGRAGQMSNIKRDELLERLRILGVDTREFFVPLHKQPALFPSTGSGQVREKYPVSEDLSKRGFYIPSGLAITEKQIETVANSLKQAINELS